MAIQRVFTQVVLAYVSAVNIGSVGIFYYDKWQAWNGGKRVSEKTLCGTALYGGWIGGLLAMKWFRHKTRKQSFRRRYAASIACNILFSIPLSAFPLASPEFRAQVAANLPPFLCQKNPSAPSAPWRGERAPPPIQ